MTDRTIPWYKMPIRLRALPFNERVDALKKYEERFGPYEWEKEFNVDAYADVITESDAD